MSTSECVLVIAPHPDDEVLGCGGVIARHSRRGDQVHVVIVTRGIPEIFPPESIENTRLELNEAHHILGVASVIFLDFPAPRLDVTSGQVIADSIRAVVSELHPDTIYLPHHGDIHGDHRAVNMATIIAARPNGAVCVSRLLAYETLSETEWGNLSSSDAFRPTVFVDISDYLPDKLKAMECYESQLKHSPHARSLEAIRALATYRGHTVNLAAAEAFMLVREIVL
jgi:LmbE family N-acetylglucosaminyl deacetylase